MNMNRTKCILKKAAVFCLVVGLLSLSACGGTNNNTTTKPSGEMVNTPSPSPTVRPTPEVLPSTDVVDPTYSTGENHDDNGVLGDLESTAESWIDRSEDKMDEVIDDLTTNSVDPNHGGSTRSRIGNQR